MPETPAESAASGTALLVGALLDGILENAALGTSLYAGGRGLGLVLLAAIFLGNVTESISSWTSMREEGRSHRYIALVCIFAAVVCTLATIAGYVFLRGSSANLISALLAFAAGGILAMLANIIMPDAFEHGGSRVALATVVGFISALLVSRLTE